MTHPNLRALVALDLDLNSSTNAIWARSIISAMTSGNIQVDFLSRTTRPGEFELSVQSFCNNIIDATSFSEEGAHDDYGITPRFRVRQVIALAKSEGYDFVLTQGIELSRYVAGGKALQSSLWAICDDSPFDVSKFTPQELKHLEVIARGAKLVLTGSPSVRGMLESTIPSVTSKTRLLPSFKLELSDVPKPSSNEQVIFYDSGLGYSALSTLDFSLLVKEATKKKTPPRVVLTGIDDPNNPDLLEVLESTGLKRYPGLQLSKESVLDSPLLSQQTVLLLPTQTSGLATDFFAQVSKQTGIATWWPEDESFALESIPTGSCANPLQPNSDMRLTWSSYFANDLADYRSIPQQPRKVRVLLAGADFKFAGDLVDSLIQRSDIELRVDLFEANAKPQPEKSKKLLPWADVVIAEFASYNAIWYSQNILPHQKLVVHLHGYELLQPWINELNLSNCAKIVFASEFYKNKAVRLRDWPEERLHVIPNSVNSADLDRPKSADARFHIGLVGIVPILKRPDRAISLIKKLLESDPRYILHVKGHRPWDYAWEWKKAAHQDSYRAFFESIAKDPDIFQRIVFEPFTPDIGNWLQKIGWLLSPSYRETFHLSAIEGAASGAVPLAWTREGSMEIIGEKYNFSSTEEVAGFIVSSNCSESSFEATSEAAKRSVERYDIPRVRAQWLKLIFDLAQKSANQTADDSPTLSPEEMTVSKAVEKACLAEDYEAALAILDENIPVTRSSTSELKHIEMFVRGLLGMDEARLNRFLPESNDTKANSSSFRFHLVRPAGRLIPGLTVSGLDRSETALDIPCFFQGPHFGDAAESADFIEMDLAGSTFSSSRRIRFDRAIHLAKAEIMQDVVENGRDYIIAAGPWWIALPALLAADQLATPSAWLINDASVWSALQNVHLQHHSNNYVAHTIRSLFNRADVRVVESSVLSSNALLADIDVIIGSDLSDSLPQATSWLKLQNALTQAGNRRLEKEQTALTSHLSDLRVAVISSTDFLNELRSLCPMAFAVDAKDLHSSLSPEIDAVIVNADASKSAKWDTFLSGRSSANSSKLTEFLDKCRVYGIPSIYLDTQAEAIAPQSMNVLRKVDHLALALPQSATPLLELHPIAVKSVTPWLYTQPLATALTTVFRGAGLAVVPQHLVQPSHLEEEELESSSVSEDLPAQWTPEHEGIALYFPASEMDEAKKISHACGLPSSLLSLRPVDLLGDVEDSSDELMRSAQRNEGGYVCVLNNISSLPEYFLTSMWLSAAHDVVVRPDFKSPESAQLYVEQCELENFSVKLGDLYPSSLFESHRESITVVHLPVFSSHPKDGC